MTNVTAADIIAHRRRIRVRHDGPRSIDPKVILRRSGDRGMAAAAVDIITQRAFVEGLVDVHGHVVDPATTRIEAVCGDEGYAVITMTAAGRQPVELHYAPDGSLSVLGPDGMGADIGEWRDLPDVLPRFIRT